MPDRGSSVRAASLVIACFALAAGALVRAAPIADAEIEKTTRNVVCDCGCPPQSIYDCTCGHADKLTADIRAEMETDGLDGDAMLARWLERHGDTARLVPEAKGFSLVAWLAPVLAIPLFGLLIYRFVRRSSMAVPEPAAPAASPSSTESLATPERERLQRAFEEWDA